MNIRVAAFTVSKKSINIKILYQLQQYDTEKIFICCTAAFRTHFFLNMEITVNIECVNLKSFDYASFWNLTDGSKWKRLA